MDLKKLFLALLVLAILAPTSWAAEGDSNFTNVVASGDVTVGDDLVVGDDFTATGDVTAASVIVTQYVEAQYFSNVTRPASGAPVGSIIVLGNDGTSCGIATAGTTLNVCVSNGTNWIKV